MDRSTNDILKIIAVVMRSADDVVKIEKATTGVNLMLMDKCHKVGGNAEYDTNYGDFECDYPDS